MDELARPITPPDMGPKTLFGHDDPALLFHLLLSIYFENKDAPRFAGGIWWVGEPRSPVRVLLLWHVPSVGPFVIGFVASGVVVLHRLHAVLAEFVAVGCVLAVAAAGAARLGLLAVAADLPAVLTRASGLGFGAGGFFVVVSGAHACMVPRRCPHVNFHARTFCNNNAPRSGALWAMG